MGRPPVLQGNSTYNSKVSSRGGATAAITSSRSSGSISSFKRVACIGVRIHVYINTGETEREREREREKERERERRKARVNRDKTRQYLLALNAVKRPTTGRAGS